MPPIRRGLATVLLVACFLATSLVGVAHAGDGRLVLDDSGANGALSASLLDSRSGSALIRIKNVQPFWTTIDVSVLGVELAPRDMPSEIYDHFGLLPPDSVIAWDANWRSDQAAQVFLRTTPYIHHTKAGPFAAALTLLTIVAEVALGALPEWDRLVARAEVVRDAVGLVQGLLGDDLAYLLSVEGLSSGDFGRRLFQALENEQQVEVLREALRLLGVEISTDALQKLNTLLRFVDLSVLTFRLLVALVSGTSSGGVVFNSEGVDPPVRTPTTQPPSTSAATPTTTAPLTTSAQSPTSAARAGATALSTSPPTTSPPMTSPPTTSPPTTSPPTTLPPTTLPPTTPPPTTLPPSLVQTTPSFATLGPQYRLPCLLPDGSQGEIYPESGQCGPIR